MLLAKTLLPDLPPLQWGGKLLPWKVKGYYANLNKQRRGDRGQKDKGTYHGGLEGYRKTKTISSVLC